MKPIGFVICVNEHDKLTTRGKIYPYYNIVGPYLGDYQILIKNDQNFTEIWYMNLEFKSINEHRFDFYHHPEFPEDINQWTEDDWFQYNLKYGE